jgi:hypothetical protein
MRKLALAALLLSVFAHAQEDEVNVFDELRPAAAPSPAPSAQPTPAAATPAPAEPEWSPWRLAITGGATLYSNTDSIVKFESKAIGSTKQRTLSAPIFGAEVTFQNKPKIPALVGALIEWSQNRNIEGKPDTELGIYALIRLQKSVGVARIWAGMGMGLMIVSFGGQLSGVVDGISLAVKDTSTTAFAITPRVGADFEILEGITLGAQAAFHSYSAAVSYDAIEVSSGNSGTGSLDLSKSFWSMSARLGFEL